MMMEPPVGNQKNLPSGDLAIDHPAHVDACLADQETAELDDQACLRQRAPCASGEHLEVLADGAEVEPSLAREIGNAKAAADVEHAHRRRRKFGQADSQLDRLLLRLADRFRLQVLRAAVDMEAFE